jgi:outer membrane receptor protein involved in Fe transport
MALPRVFDARSPRTQRLAGLLPSMTLRLPLTLAAAILALVLFAASGPAQVAPKPPATPAAAPAKESETIMLTAFAVSADAADTYEATNTNSVTGTNTPLSKTPLDAKVFNRQMLDEMGTVDMTDMLWKIGGLGPAVINASEDVRGMVEGDRQDPKSMSMRGLQINNPRRDGFLRSDTTLLDTFDIERVEAIGGSNSLLFGSGDAGGVITSTSKRAYLNRRPTGSVSALMDSEGSRRYTLDAGFGQKYFGFRVNGVRDDTKYFKPGLKRHAEGYHLAATIQPWKRLQIRGEYRYYNRDTIFAQAVTITAPTTWLLPSRDPLGYPIPNASNTNTQMNGKNIRYLVAFPEARALLGNVFDYRTLDSGVGPFHRDDYFNRIKSVVAELAITDELGLQLRYGHDARVNDAFRASSTTAVAPGVVSNAYVDPATGAVGQRWAFNTTQVTTPYFTGARGYRAALAYRKNLGKWFGNHQGSVFRQAMESWANQYNGRFYEVDAGGNIIQNLANLNNSESGRNVMPSVWMPLFPQTIIGGQDWRIDTVRHPNGKTYKYAPQVYAGAVAATAANPMGISGGVNATTGNPSNTSYIMDDTDEKSWGGSLFSEWWGGRIDTMAGVRREEATGLRKALGQLRGPISYDSTTLGVVADTPVRDLRIYTSYSSNGKINFDTTRDINNEPLPPGKGVSRDVGFKFDLFGRRLSGNVAYYKSEAQNFTSSIGNRDDVDPAGINGRHGGNAFVYSKTSNGYSLVLNGRPLRNWEVRASFTTANGSERSDVILPQFYNDQFNTMTVGGQTVVAIKSTSGGLTPLTVPTDPRNPDSAPVPLSLAMMKDQNSPYFAQLDVESGQILNAQALGLNTTGVGTGVNGLPVKDHQLGFNSPSGGTLIVRKAGEQTAGYAERAYSLVNTYRVSEGMLRGLSLGLITSYQQNYRGYMYNDSLDGKKRKMFYFPDRLLNDMFASYGFRLSRTVRASVQLNVSNLLDSNRILYLVSSTDGAFRYGQLFNSPRKVSITTRLTY